uniref:hypothetical protein n=1 Tax=Anoxybacillus gonensis TaxID=198467 RepID=UPI00300F910B
MRADVKEEFQDMAEQMGMTISALGSYVIGKFVVDHKRNRELQEKMIMPAVNELVKMIADDMPNKLEFLKFIEELSGQMENKL